MNAKNSSTVRFGLIAAALGLCGALALSVSCAGGEGGSGGSGGGGEGGGGEGGGGEGGEGGGSGTCSPGENEVCFATGKADGVIKGYGYIALGKEDSVSSPVCDNSANGGPEDQPITKDEPCPEDGGSTKWSSEDALCISGNIPVVEGGNYTDNWGIQIGMNVTEEPGGTLEKKYKTITYHFNADGVEPANKAIRGIVHRKDDDIEASYCATVQSGTPVTLTAFNTKCWDNSGDDLTEDDVANIDKLGLQVSSDASKQYTLTDFCLSKIEFAE